MSVPRVLLAPTHHTGLADAIAAAVAEIATALGSEVRYHHVGPLGPACSWDRWEGAVFVDPALCGEDALLGLYDVAVRHADLSLLSSCRGVLDRQDGARWTPADVARLLDCPLVVIVDCRGWGTGMKVVTTGLRDHLAGVNWAGAILTGVANSAHYDVLREFFAEIGVPVAGCLFQGEELKWDTRPPGPWGFPFEADLLETVSRQVDVNGLIALAGQRGFLSKPNWPTDRSEEGPTIVVAGGKGFTPWSRDSIEALRAAGAQLRRVDLIDDTALPEETAGLILAGTLWPPAVPDIALNISLLNEIATKIRRGLPTVALGGGMLLLLDQLQDLLGRTSDLAGILPVQGEILWDLEDPTYVKITSERDNLLFAKGEEVTGWVLTDVELATPRHPWNSPFSVRGGGVVGERGEGLATDSLLCTPVLVHFAASRGTATKFVQRCAEYATHRA